MVHPPPGIGHPVRGPTLRDGPGLSFYIIHDPEMEEEVLPFCLFDGVASERVPERDGAKGNKMINGQWSMINTQLSLLNDH